MKKVLFIILASFMTFGTAQAVDFSIGIGANQSVFAATGKEEKYTETGTLELTTEEHGAFKASYPSLFGEIGINENFSVGVSIQGDFDTPTNVNDAAGATATSTVSASFQNYATAYALIKVPLGGTYIKVGTSKVDVIVNETQLSGNTYPDTQTDGEMVAIGYQFNTDTGFSVRAEIAGHQFNDVSVDNGKGTSGNLNKITVNEMIGATGTVSIVKTF